jgi:folylpolyglutamate synthase
MAAVSKSDYEKVVSTLNGLQTNAQVLAEIRKQSKNLSEVRFASVGVHLNRIGIDVDDLDDLNIIHVAGTKGKVSTNMRVNQLINNWSLLLIDSLIVLFGKVSEKFYGTKYV